MKYIQNFHDKTEPEVLTGIGNIDYPVIIGGGNTNEGIKVFIVDNQESLNTKLTNANSIEEAFDITYKPYIINGYDQRMTLENSFGFYGKTYNAYATGILSKSPVFYNYSKVSPVTFSSTNTDVATVDSNGVVTVIASGTTNIKVSFAGNDRYLPYETSYLLTVDIPIVIEPEPDYPVYNGHKYVDLGLPSGRKWSAYNMSANAVNEYGTDTYYWGDPVPVSTEHPHNQYDPNDEREYTKYNDEDGETTLDLSDDAAHVNWGGNWKTPTVADFNELCNENYTTIEIIKNYLGRGASGLLITSKTNGNTLFFPLDSEGEWATIKLLTNKLWYTDTPYVWRWYCWWDLDQAGFDDYDVDRSYSYPIRPVF